MIKEYRINGSDEYQIDYRPQGDGTIKLFAPIHPPDPYGGAVTDNHLYPSGEICVARGNEPRTMDRAKAIAYFWMEGYSKFIRTGKFANDGGRVRV